jgi:release factor glutamine methyltransferase
MNRAEALADLRRAFADAGLDSPSRDARLLVLAALAITPADLLARPEDRITREQAETIAAYARRRLGREPVSRILGEWEFWGLPFALSPDTLVPRPETETVVETALKRLPDRPGRQRVLDLGTGTGCLLVAVLHERPRATGLGIDRSPGALATARANAHRNGVGTRTFFAASDWTRAVGGRFDLIVSNPPYIASAVVSTLEADVREHDPILALDGGRDGLEAYRIILADAPRLLAPDGVIVVEIGYDQADAITGLAASTSLEIVELVHDLSGNARCVALKRT